MRKIVLAGVLVVLGGCVTVRPWERGRLASPAMQFQQDPFADEQEQSILEITEGATYASAGAGAGGAGAGCGCH